MIKLHIVSQFLQYKGKKNHDFDVVVLASYSESQISVIAGGCAL